MRRAPNKRASGPGLRCARIEDLPNRAAAHRAQCPVTGRHTPTLSLGKGALCHRVYLEQGLWLRCGLPETLGTSTMRILAPVGCYERHKELLRTAFPVSACSWAPGCTSAGAS